MRPNLKNFHQTITVLFLGIIVIFTTGNNLKAQSPCMPTVPSFTINLTGSPAGTWSSPNISRNDQCCTATPPDQCVYFHLTLDSNSAGIQIDMIGADPAGALFYDIGCTGNYPGGQIKCITGVGPHQITFCKPGGNKNIFTITSISKPLFPNDDTVRIGCKEKLITLGCVGNSVTWQSIYPGTPGQYNSYLDATNIPSPTYSPSAGAPPYVDYKVCGFPQASACGFSVTVCDTVRIYNYPVLSGIVTPNSAMFCNVGPGSGVTLTASGVGGLPAYSYTWLTSANVFLGTGATYFATAAGSYKLEIKDQLYDPENCPAAIQSPITVITGTTPIVDACPSQKLCATNPVASISGTVQYANGIWTGGAGTYNPGNTYMNLTYSPTPAEITAGFVKLYLTSTSAGGGCINQRDSTIIYFSSPLNVSIATGTLACNNSTTTLVGVVSGGTMPYYYQWNTGSAFSSITGGQGNYSLLVADSLGCLSSIVSTNVIAPTPLNITFSTIDCTTNGGSDGSASVSVTGGTPAYSVTWTPTGLNTFTITNLSYGIYTASIMDANGCFISGSTVVNEPPCLGFTVINSSTNVLCYGDANGIATVTVSGGTPVYTYTWNTNPVQNTSTATNLNAGVYTVLIRDAVNCLQAANVTITEPAVLTNVMTYTNNTIIGGSNGTAAANPFGGTSPYTYLWNTAPTQTTSTISNLPSGVYAVNVTDNNGCVKTDSIRISEPPCNTNLNVFPSNVSCFGGSNGSAIAIVSSAFGAYTVSWSNGAFGPVVAGLNPGNYLVTVTDAVNCVVFKNFSIVQPSQLSVGVSPVNSRCNGLNNGTIDLTISGGIFPYSFNWSNGSTAEDQANLAPGSYSVQIRDANGCTAVASTAITEPAALVVTYTSQNVSCIYGTNGSISLTASGGIFPYSYSWSTGATTSSITNLAAGGYSFSVKDYNNCITNAPVTIGITQPDSVMVNSFIVGCSVPGSGQTQVTVVPSGGYTSTYQVSYNNGVTYQSPGVYTTMLNNSTTYSVIVKDANNCLSLIPDIITILPEVKIDSVRFSKCYAVGTTSVPVTVYPSGGNNGPYSVSFNNGSTYLATGTYSSNISVASSYTVIIKDSRGCVSAVQIITLPAILNATVSVTSNYNGQNVSCFGLTDGSALVNASGGSGVYTYSWSTTPTQTTTAANNLGAGTYSVTIMDGNNCPITKTITLTQPVVVTPTATATSNYNGQNVSCFGYSNGTASVTPNGGTAPYTYLWNTVPSQTTAIATGLSAGTYSVVVKDVNNCAVTTTVTLIQPTASFTSSIAVISNYNGQHVSCYGAANASITATAYNGTGPYTYTWSTTPVQTGTLAIGIGAGIYTVTMNDINSCSITNTITVSEPPAIVATTSVTSNYNGQNISCFGLTDGSANVTPTGGTSPYTYLWSSVPSQTTANASNLGAGTYSVTVTDVNGCSVIKTVTLTEPATLTSTLSITSNYNGQNVSCFGLTDGSALATTSGGTGSYSYTWSTVPAQTTASANNLGAGTYSVIITDGNNCAITKTITLSEPIAVTPTAVATSNYNGQNVSCFGYADGTASVTPTGGTAPYTYLWNTIPSQTTAIATGLSAGTYSVVVKDVNNCAVTTTVTLIQSVATLTSNVAIISNYNGQDVSCFGAMNASITATAFSGTGPYTYTWSTTPVQTGTLAIGIGAGTYTVTMNDINGCSITNTITVSEPPVIGATTSVTSNFNGQNISCFGLTDGVAGVTPTGGTSPYTYIWSSVPSQTTANASNLGAGTYSVTVTDVNGCSVIKTVTLTEPTAVTSTVAVTSNYNGQNVSCFGITDGSALATTSGGTGSYTYSWSTTPAQTSALAGNLGAGTYTVIIKDVNNCTITQTITLTQPATVTSTAVVTSNFNGQSVSCFGYADGTASVTANGGTAPYTYAWNTIPSQTTFTANGLSAGTYSVVVKDVNNCAVTTTVTLIQPAATFASSVAVISDYNGEDVSCFGAMNASITATAFNGTGPYTYTWSTTPVQTGTLAIGIGAGTYTVTMNDMNSCSITNTITVSEPLIVNATTSVTSDYNGQNISCFGLTNGSASVTPTGGITPYSYLWNTVPSQNTANALNIGAGTYSVTVTDVNGCATIKTVSLNQPTPVNAQIIGVSLYNGYNVSCFQSTNGYIDVSVNGGTGSYTYNWSNSTNTQDIVSLGAGNYSVVVSDINGCKDSLTSAITEPNKLVAIIDSISNYNGYNVSCFGSQNGSVYVSVIGGVQNYNYTWSNNTANQDLSNVGVGSYTLLVSDMNLCTASINTLITQPPALTFTSSVIKPLCNGYQTGAIDITVGGGVVPYSYNWSNNASTEDISNIAAGIYSIKYTDKNGCKDSAVINVTQPDTITLVKVVDILKCFGDTIGNIYLTPAGGTTPYAYLWSDGSTTKDLNNIGAGKYSVIITDANGCTYNDTTKLVEPPPLELNLSSPTLFNGYNVSSYNGSDGSIIATISGGCNPFNCLWSNGNNTQELYNLSSGKYFVTVSDSNECRITGEIILTQPLVLEMPQGYSPNSDGKNESFVIHGIEAYPDNVLTIYNRWGNIVYSKNGYFNEWDGNSNNGQALPDATYFAILEVNKGEIVLKGYVELRR